MNDYVIVGAHHQETKCAICGGSGNLGERECWDCKGRGKFEDGCGGVVTQSRQYGHAFCSQCGAVPREAVK